MKRRILSILVLFVFWVPGIAHAENTAQTEATLSTSVNVASQESSSINNPSKYLIPANTASQATSIFSPREWYIVAKLPTGKGLAIGVFWIQEGMPIEHIYSVMGNPQDTITAGTEDCYGTVLVYPHHYLLFSRTGNLQTIKERK